MAWMKSASSGNWFLTTEFTQRKITDPTEAARVSAVLGFQSVVCSSEDILAEQARVTENRAALIADIAAAVKAPS